ncbi:hypothetical protein [Candidatus Mesenet endosymbiont of Agriotes lineatus]|uniref:hypothetical protein n=1 Tax=Candidatus Mesenet endosymbiont of Agriotes lineatus TaxID=3077948 RepID=UPI0030D39773
MLYDLKDRQLKRQEKRVNEKFIFSVGGIGKGRYGFKITNNRFHKMGRIWFSS